MNLHSTTCRLPHLAIWLAASTIAIPASNEMLAGLMRRLNVCEERGARDR